LNPQIYFDVAYAPHDNSYSDTLALYYSLDCGNTFTQVYLKGGMTLCTTGVSVANGADTTQWGCFVPLSANWRTDTINIPAISGQTNVMFSFEHRSGSCINNYPEEKGTRMYIDNINIPGVITNVVNNIKNNTSVNVYPNPGNGIFSFQLSGVIPVAIGSHCSVEVYNVLGQKVFSQFNIQNPTFNIDLSAQPKGVYIYKIYKETGESLYTGRVVVE